jgi:CheY-like chemotaxis protein
VDDSTYNIFVIEELLKQLGDWVQVDSALNGQLALDLVASNHYDVILLDLHMPVLDGYETAKQLRHLHQTGTISMASTKVVALSAITESQFAANQEQRQYFDSFSKDLMFTFV